MESLILKR